MSQTLIIQGLQGPANVLTIGTVTTGAGGSAATATLTGVSPTQALSLTIPQGLMPWLPAVAWAATTAYVVGPPASCVTYGGGTYVCSTAHTSGSTFDATKWTAIAAPGDSSVATAAATSATVSAAAALASQTAAAASATSATSSASAASTSQTAAAASATAAAASAASIAGAVVYQGTWNASTNTPTLVSSVGTKGWYYKVSVAGTTSINGNAVWSVGDSILFDGTTWDKLDGPAEAVISVAGRIGVVVLSSADLSDKGAASGVATLDGSSLVPAAQLRTPTTVALGAVLSAAAGANQFQTGINTSGAPTFAQPSFSNLSGSIAASQLPAFTGDVTTTAGAVATTIGANVVTYAKFQTMAAASLHGNPTGSIANSQAITLGSGLQFTGSTLAAITGTSGAAIPFLNGANTWSTTQTLTLAPIFSALTGYLYGNGASAITASTTIPASALSGTLAAAQHPALTGAITTVAGNLATTLSAGAVGLSNMANMAAYSVLGNNTGSTGAVINLSPSNVLDIIGATQGSVLFRGATLWTALGPGTAGQVLQSGGATANPAWATISPINLTVRQTVSAGPVDTNGLPTLFPATSSSLVLTTQNVSSSAPLVFTAAQGSNVLGNVDYIYGFTSNQSWTLTASATNYLYVNASTGVLGFTTLQPIYQFGGTPAVTSGQFTFNISQMTGYMGNGTTAPATPLVFIGECVCGASTITSATAYAYNGIYTSALQAWPSGSSGISLNHNLGVGPVGYDSRWKMVCVTTNNGYSIGEEINIITLFNGASSGVPFFTPDNASRLAAQIATNNNSTYDMTPKAGGSATSITTADWNIRAYIRRNF